jgi:hypothetical protein
MNALWFGDSYDIVKRFFVDQLRTLGYEVFVDPMPTEEKEWVPYEDRFLRLMVARHVRSHKGASHSALLLDPDTGVTSSRTARHANTDRRKHSSIGDIKSELHRHEIVFAFDQSFSRAVPAVTQMLNKMSALREEGVHAFYYDSHARFLFCSFSRQQLDAVRMQLTGVGLPAARLIGFDQMPTA